MDLGKEAWGLVSLERYVPPTAVIARRSPGRSLPGGLREGALRSSHSRKPGLWAGDPEVKSQRRDFRVKVHPERIPFTRPEWGTHSRTHVKSDISRAFCFSLEN